MMHVKHMVLITRMLKLSPFDLGDNFENLVTLFLLSFVLYMQSYTCLCSCFAATGFPIAFLTEVKIV